MALTSTSIVILDDPEGYSQRSAFGLQKINVKMLLKHKQVAHMQRQWPDVGQCPFLSGDILPHKMQHQTSVPSKH